MTKLIVMTFDEVQTANEVRAKMKGLEREGVLKLEDAAVITKDENDKVHVVNEMGNTVKGGAAIGGILGLLLIGLFPVAGIIAGVAGGALIGKMVNEGVDKDFVKEVSASLKPGNSAVFLEINEANASAALAALEPFKGHLYHTNVSSEMEEEIREALE
jgi:uncharacterized membrane protein